MINQEENGRKSGLWSEPEGAGTWLGYYENGEKEGSWSYYEGHSLTKLANYRSGLKQGLAYKFGPSGNLLLELAFEKDRIHGKVKFFSSAGEHIATYGYIYDKLADVELYVLHDESPPKHETYLPKF